MQANPPGQVGPCLTVDTHGCDILLLLYDIVIKLMLSNPKQPSCKKKCAALRKAMVKKDVKSKVAAKKWL